MGAVCEDYALKAATPRLRHLLRARIAPRILRPLKLAARAGVAGWVVFAGLNAQAADPSGVAAAFGNTVISSYPDGTSQKIWLHADGSWSGLSRRNVSLEGRWTIRSDKVCLRQTRPATLPISYCTPLPASSQPGVKWAGRDVAGRSITLSLMKGMPSQYQSSQYQSSNTATR
jgi:hypothetical protein